MGHYLDLLLPMKIQSDGEELPTRGVLNFVGFTLSDDGTIITIEGGGGGGGTLAGDVRGPSDENRVAVISGDEETEAVLFQCGTQFLPDTITHNQTLAPDGTLFYVNTGEGEPINVKLPAATEGRTFLLVVTGAGGVSLRRLGSELINSVASHLSFSGPCIMVIVCDGTDWTARAIADAPVDDGGAAVPAMTFSPVDILRTTPISGTVPQYAGGGQASGAQFFVRPGTLSVVITGIRFYWAGAAAKTIRCDLWDPLTSSTVPAATVDVVTAGIGVYAGTFAAPYTVPTNRYQARYIVSVWDTAGAHYTFTTGSTTELSAFIPARPFFAGRIGWVYFNRFRNAGWGMTDTDASNEWYLVEPIVEEV